MKRSWFWRWRHAPMNKFELWFWGLRKHARALREVLEEEV